MQATQEEIEVADEVLDRAEINNGQALVKYSKTEATLIDLRARYKDAKFDLTTTAGDKAARAARLELVTLRTGLEKKRKELKAPALDFTKLIDGEAARIKAEIEALENPINAQIVADEERRAGIKAEKDRLEAERVDALQKRLDAIRACATKAQGISAERIEKGIGMVEAIDVANGWEEFTVRAVTAKAETLSTMRELLEQAQAREAEAARVEQQRLENERIAAEQAAEAKRLKAIADEQAAQQKAAADALAASQKAVADKLAAEQAKLAEQQAELQRQRELLEAQQREAKETEEARECLAQEKAVAELPAPTPAPAPVVEPVAAVKQPAAAPVAEPTTPPTLKLGTIAERLSAKGERLPLTADFLKALGFEPAETKGASKLYREESFPAICAALVKHINSVPTF